MIYEPKLSIKQIKVVQKFTFLELINSFESSAIRIEQTFKWNVNGARIVSAFWI